MPLDVPRDRHSSFEPQLVKKRQRRLHGVDEMAISLPEFVLFLDYDAELRRVIYATNAIELLHARMRRATRARGDFPNEQAALKCLYTVVRSLDPIGRGRRRWMNRWKPALNAFAITFEGRLLPAGE